MKNNKKLKNAIIMLLVATLLVLILVPKDILKEPKIIGKVLAQVMIKGGTLPPYFVENLTNQSTTQGQRFQYDINCSDPEPADIITYYDNFSGFRINSSTGLINTTITNLSLVGNSTINITCSDGTFNVSEIFVLTLIEGNVAPELNPIGPQITLTDELFTFDVDATDANNDNLTFGSNSTIFTINSVTGMINFTPTVSQVGTYSINITVFDGLEYDYEVIIFTVTRGPYCGDAACSSSELCSNCSSDCGSCPSSGSGAQGSSTGTSGGSGGAITESGSARAPYYRCDEKWECTPWTNCTIESIQVRKCKDVNKCITKAKKPVELQSCNYVPTCDDSIKNGEEEDVDCGGNCKPCYVPNCFDSIKNQDELGIDCGGICKPCEIKKFQRLPFVELPVTIPKIPKRFPWMLIILMIALIILMVVSDRAYLKYLKRQKFDVYRKKILKYYKWKRRIYTFVLDIALVTIVASLYIWYFSDEPKNMVGYSYIPLLIMIIIPPLVPIMMRKFAYYEYKKRMKEQRFRETHKREIVQLIDLENKLLGDIEQSVKKRMYSLALYHKFDSFPQLYHEINPIYLVLARLDKIRKERDSLTRIGATVYSSVTELADNVHLKKLAKDYPEYYSVLENLKYIEDNIDIDTIDKEESLVYDIKEISKTDMIVVAQSNPAFTSVYNQLVDIHDYFEEKNKELQETDEHISAEERALTDNVKEIGKKPAIMDVIQKENDFAVLYNGFVDLFNHYMKKQELSSRVRGL